MLERTAATLESCTSLHALPSASRSLRSRRKLHTGFWQHGAAAIDISNPALAMQPNDASLSVSEPPTPRPETLAASTFLLDFLYPSGTAAFLRKLAPGLPDHHQASIRRLPRRSRPFTSSTVANPLQCHDSQPIQHDQATSASVIEDRQHSSHEGIDPAEEEEEFEDEEEEKDEEDAITSSQDTHSGPSYAGAGSRPDLMKELMAEKDTEYFGSIWQLYSQLDPSLQPELRSEVIVYLYRSTNVIDARRVSLLFSEMDASQWTPEILTSAVAAHLRLGRETEALSLYHEGLDTKGMVGGLDELLQYAFTKADWKRVKDVWVSYHASDAYRDADPLRLGALSSVSNIGKLVIDFARFIGASRMGEEMEQKLGILLRQAAQVALRQPCKPEEALPLLKIIDSAEIYITYLREALARGQRERLPEIYRVYRDLPSTTMPHGILHGMFDVFYPDDVLGLEQVYEDFHRSDYGRLDRPAFRKYLTFYASRGDIKSLERLSDIYVRTWNSEGVVLFNHMINAYANLGDYDGARRVFDEMRYKHRTKPTVKSWNQLLKSCLQEATYDRAKLVFEELCGATRPNAVTFATMMSLAASKGDLEFTLDLLQQARSRQVRTDVPILQAVVRAYCYNGRFREALATCIEAKNTNVPGDHAELWNTLLRRHSDRRAFDEVCEIVALMAQHGVQWTPETHKVLLRALVDCKQAHPAYKVLHATVRNRSFTLDPEHFVIVMEGGLRLRQLKWTSKLDKMMRTHAGLPLSIDARLAQARTLIKKELFGNRQSPGKADGSEDLMEYIRQMVKDVETATQMDADPGNDTQRSLKRADSLYRLRQLMVKAIALFTRYRDFESVRELRKLQAKLGQEGLTPAPKNLSVDMLHSLMQENVHGKSYDAAKENWELIWQKSVELARPASYGGQGPSAVLPRYRYSLSKPFGTLQEMFSELRDSKSLKANLDRLLDAGFLLDNRAMNHVCQALAQMGYWLDACKLCELHLMPNWTGWQVNRVKRGLKANIPLEQRRMGNAPHWLRPTSYTLTILAKEYGDLVAMAPWSSTAAETARVLQEQCPRVVNALGSLPYSGIGIEREVFGRQKTMSPATRTALRKPSGQREPKLATGEKSPAKKGQRGVKSSDPQADTSSVTGKESPAQQQEPIPSTAKEAVGKESTDELASLVQQRQQRQQDSSSAALEEDAETSASELASFPATEGESK
ncbi:CoxI translation protein CYA5 [Colletotrichum tofieldiae]|nr:CoxI translation protein CYA5 [Colletotrichum tofieldiae]GKT69849.1 CoxI translation protein CYA5 [Colletotrichum tofieldiae]